MKLAVASDKFIEFHVKLWFSESHWHNSKLVLLMEEFRIVLWRSIQQHRPAGRKQGCRSDDVVLGEVAYLEDNLFNISNPHPLRTPQGLLSIAVEFKVKCGLKSVSPFLQSYARIKHIMSRYELMQHYKFITSRASQSSQMGWGDFTRESTYDPCELCSQDALLIHQALSALIDNPQNNLRVLVNASHVYGWDQSNDPRDLATELRKVGISDLSNFQSVLVRLIAQEDIFARLQAMQHLDCIDAEGATLVYNRGVSLCGGNVTLFDDCLLQFLSSKTRPEDDRYRSLLPSEVLIAPTDSDADIEVKLDLAKSLVSMWSLDEVLQTLRAWMISYSAKDASVILSTRWSPLSVAVVATDSSKIVVQSKTASSAIEQSGRESVPIVDYHVRILDIGLKPLSKFLQRSVQDFQICRVVSESVNVLNGNSPISSQS
jgi:hypothetical protein